MDGWENFEMLPTKSTWSSRNASLPLQQPILVIEFVHDHAIVNEYPL